jgi:hypothetical protein
MPGEPKRLTNRILIRATELLLDLPWLEIAAEMVKVARRLWKGLADEGIYEVLEHVATLELKDRGGKQAKVRKRQKVRYRQNNIIAYQDQAWGDGESLINYRCSPGRVVDRWRPGNKTYLLISLRDAKRRGDEEEFRMEWGIRNGFLRTSELWETGVGHRTKQLEIQAIFPKNRPPQKVWIEEHLRRRKHLLGADALVRLVDQRWLVSWEKKKPRLNERYQLHWEW